MGFFSTLKCLSTGSVPVSTTPETREARQQRRKVQRELLRTLHKAGFIMVSDTIESSEEAAERRQGRRIRRAERAEWEAQDRAMNDPSPRTCIASPICSQTETASLQSTLERLLLTKCCSNAR